MEYLAVVFGRNELMERIFGVLFFYEKAGEIDIKLLHRLYEREREDMLTILYRGPSEFDARKKLRDSEVYLLHSENEVIPLIPIEDMEKYKLSS